MKWDKTLENKNQKKSSQCRYKLGAVFITLSIIAALIFVYFTQDQNSDPASEKFIREAAATRLGKYQNELYNGDFEKITELTIDKKTPILNLTFDGTILSQEPYDELSDIILLKKFTNLKTLNMGSIDVPKSKIPKWMSLLVKLGIYHVDEKFSLDLRPLEKLNHLEKLQLGGKAIKNINPLKNLNLKELQLLNSPVSNLKPVKSIKNLQTLFLINCENLTDEHINELQKALPNLKIYNWK